MSVVVVIPPATLPVTLDAAKLHLGMDANDDDAMIKTMIEAATGLVDGPNGWLGRALITQTLEVTRDNFWADDECSNSNITLICQPIQSITSVKYIDNAGVEQTFDAASYQLSGEIVSPAFGASWPTPRRQNGAVRIRYIAGYGTADDVPAPIKSAILLMVGNLFSNREAVTDKQPFELPLAFQTLLSPYRIVAV